MHLVGCLYGAYHDARSLEHKVVEIYVFGGMLRLQLQHKGTALFMLVYSEDGYNLCPRNFGSFLPD
jgi:hypothetical protein